MRSCVKLPAASCEPACFAKIPGGEILGLRLGERSGNHLQSSDFPEFFTNPDGLSVFFCMGYQKSWDFVLGESNDTCGDPTHHTGGCGQQKSVSYQCLVMSCRMSQYVIAAYRLAKLHDDKTPQQARASLSNVLRHQRSDAPGFGSVLTRCSDGKVPKCSIQLRKVGP